ncbi:hypothetical protein ACI782_11690 [Geodermatophilus sp. SYSU D00703]
MSTTPPDGAPEQDASGAPTESARNGHATALTTPAAGWYPTPSGGQQYWDGETWLALPPPIDTAGPSSGLREPDSGPKNRRIVKWLLMAGGALLVLGLIGGGIAWKVADNARQAEAAAEAAAEKAATEERERQERREAAAAAAQERRDEAERAARRTSVTEIEASVKKMAEEHAADGVIDGPIIEVSCSPVGGGSTDDLTEQTTVFECFAANEDNGDGTMSGYTYNATMNWSTGSYTYGLGAP